MKIWRIQVIILFFSFFYYENTLYPYYPIPLVRIALSSNGKSASFHADNGITVAYSNGNNITYPKDIDLIVETVGYDLLINGILKKSPARLYTEGKGIFYNGKRFRGNIELRTDDNGELLVINELDVESYVKGVLSNEMPPLWDIEALMAQAVAVRTYALNKKKERLNELYHLSDNILDQVYRGMESENRKTDTAVRRTRGMVLTYKGELALAVYHSTCGGHTEKAENIWPGNGQPYLMGRRCSFDKDSPHFKWTVSIPLEYIRNALQDEGVAVGRILSLKPIIHTESGRVFRIELIHGKGTVVLTGTDFRRIIGYTKLKSTLFTVKIKGRNAVFKGSGSGHGAGLCQWGAKGMADRGYNFKQILGYYYQGASLTRLYK